MKPWFHTFQCLGSPKNLGHLKVLRRRSEVLALVGCVALPGVVGVVAGGCRVKPGGSAGPYGDGGPCGGVVGGGVGGGCPPCKE
jgi:hypothetical protein